MPAFERVSQPLRGVAVAVDRDEPHSRAHARRRRRACPGSRRARSRRRPPPEVPSPCTAIPSEYQKSYSLEVSSRRLGQLGLDVACRPASSRRSRFPRGARAARPSRCGRAGSSAQSWAATAFSAATTSSKTYVLTAGAPARRAVEGVDEVVERLLAAGLLADERVGLEPDQLALGVVVDAAAPVRPLRPPEVEQLRRHRRVHERPPGAARLVIHRAAAIARGSRGRARASAGRCVRRARRRSTRSAPRRPTAGPCRAAPDSPR